MTERRLHSFLLLDYISSSSLKQKAKANERLSCSSWICVSRKARYTFSERTGMTVDSVLKPKHFLDLFL